MKITLITTQSIEGSTIVGRVLPFTEEMLMQNHDVHILTHKEHGKPTSRPKKLHVHVTGKDPFKKTKHGKKRLGGIRLITRMKLNALRSLITLLFINPDILIIEKPLPENVAAAMVWRVFNKKKKIILDVDDFELTANKLSSIFQRAFIHWSERIGARIADHIITATPFLLDHFKQLTNEKKEVTIIPTGVHITFDQTLCTKPTLLYIGSVSIASGHRVDMLPDILKKVQQSIPDIQLTIAGSGDDIAMLKKQFEEANLTTHINWTGRFTQHDIPDLLKKTAIIIDPIDASISNRAKSSFRTSLASAAGMPIVTSNIGIRPMLIPNTLQKRFFATPQKPSSYANTIIELIQHPITTEERNKMKQHAASYSTEKHAKEFLAIITS